MRTDDQVVPVANGRMLASAVADRRLEIIEGGSHLCPIQQPVRTARMLRDFLDDV